MKEPILQVENLSKYFGNFGAVKNLSFDVYREETFGVAGPNGAGKTTLYNAITRIPFGPTSGKVILEGREIQRLRPHKIAQLGIARTFQIPAIFRSLSYFENVLTGAVFGSKSTVQGKKPEKDAIEALDLVGLLEKKDSRSETASLLDMKLLMVASAIAMKPKILMLDEPAGGLSQSEIEYLVGVIEKLKKRSITIIVIEHIMAVLMRICDRVMIINHGEMLSLGSPAEIKCDPKVIKAYLGEEYE